MPLKSILLEVTTDAGGDGTATATRAVNGLLYAVQYVDGTLDATADITLSAVNTDSDVDQTFLTITNGANDAWYLPRVPLHDAAGTAVTFDGSNEIYGMAVINGTLKAVVAQGGNAKTGSVIVYYTE